MNILNAQESVQQTNGESISILTLQANMATPAEILAMDTEIITVGNKSYVGYLRLKTYQFNIEDDSYTIVVEKPSLLEQILIDVGAIPSNILGTSFASYKLRAIYKTKRWIDDKLADGIPYNGKIYNACKEKQDLLANQLGLYALNLSAGDPDTLSWNTKDGICEDWEFDELRKLANAMKTAAKLLQKKQQETEIEIKAAGTYEQVDEILANFM